MMPTFLIIIGMWLSVFSNDEIKAMENENFSFILSVDDLIQKAKIPKKLSKG